MAESKGVFQYREWFRFEMPNTEGIGSGLETLDTEV